MGPKNPPLPQTKLRGRPGRHKRRPVRLDPRVLSGVQLQEVPVFDPAPDSELGLGLDGGQTDRWERLQRVPLEAAAEE